MWRLVDEAAREVAQVSAAAGAAATGGEEDVSAQVLGDASFALYALQEPLWRWSEQLLGQRGVPASASFTFTFVVFALVASLAVARWLERPARRAIRTVLAQQPLAAARPPSP